MTVIEGDKDSAISKRFFDLEWRKRFSGQMPAYQEQTLT